MPAVFFYAHYDLLKRWLACMRLTFYPLVIMVIATTIHVLLCLLFVKYLDLDIIGLAIAHSLKDCLLFILTVLYSWNSE